MKKWLWTIALIALLFAYAGCGKKGPPFPPDLPTAYDEAPDPDAGKVRIVDDSAKRLFDLYGGQAPETTDEPTPAPTPEPTAESDEQANEEDATGQQ